MANRQPFEGNYGCGSTSVRYANPVYDTRHTYSDMKLYGTSDARHIQCACSYITLGVHVFLKSVSFKDSDHALIKRDYQSAFDCTLCNSIVQ
jgi:hypothetical protein